ncbi:hypothetical protein ACFQ1S_14510 [Kibdelosporangium lantanae]|uniref:Uncharacterized protein n=1 Tax=Kibdelosporangium lantanae TaxID=1497396 RepID=A0ABW3M8J2_9PSEU
MKENTSRLAGIWGRNTVLLGGLLLALGIWQGFDTPLWKLAAIIAGLLEINQTIAVIKAWLFTAHYHWFWWT